MRPTVTVQPSESRSTESLSKRVSIGKQTGIIRKVRVSPGSTHPSAIVYSSIRLRHICSLYEGVPIAVVIDGTSGGHAQKGIRAYGGFRIRTLGSSVSADGARDSRIILMIMMMMMTSVSTVSRNVSLKPWKVAIT